jgi:hypothetical protein
MSMPIVYKLLFVKIDENLLDRSCEKRKTITQSQERDEYPIYNKREGFVDWPHIVQELPSKTLLKETEGRIDVTRTRGRKRKQLKKYSKEKTGYWKFKEKARDRALWRTGSTQILERKIK